MATSMLCDRDKLSFMAGLPVTLSGMHRNVCTAVSHVMHASLYMLCFSFVILRGSWFFAMQWPACFGSTLLDGFTAKVKLYMQQVLVVAPLTSEQL